ncbi:MAG: ABC transporter substrate-binding protein [Mycobacterium leprae]
MWRKVQASVIVAALSFSLLAGCTAKQPATPAPGGAAPAQVVNLDFWAHWGSEQRMPTINKLVAQWNQANPNIQVKYTFVPFDQIMTKTLAAVAAKNPPDAVIIDNRTTAQRASKNQNTDLSALGADTLKSQFAPGLWSIASYQGKLHAMPFVTDTRFLFYNKAFFTEVGLDPAKPPTTWDELQADATKLDKQSGGKYTRMGFYPLWGNFGYEGWVNNAGATMFDPTGTTPQINNPTAVSTLTWIQNWTKKYGYANLQAFQAGFGGGGSAQNPFIAGQVAMIMDVATFASTIGKYGPNMQWGMAPVPTPNGQQGPMSSWGGGFSLEIPAGSKHPAEAFKFISWLATQGVQTWATEQNDIPANLNAVNAIAANNPLFKQIADNLQHTFISPAPMLAPNYGTAVQKAQDDVMIRNADPKTALDAAQTAVQQMIQQNKP